MRASRSLYVALTVLIEAVPTIIAFLVSPALQPQPFYSVHSRQPSFIIPTISRDQSRLYFREMDSTDAFQVLNVATTASKKEIKLAYKSMAFRYHPDVVTNQNTPPEQKRKANEIVAKINWAYAQLSEKDGATSSTTSCSTTTSTSTSSSSSPYERTHPHPRTSTSNARNPNRASSRTSSTPYSPRANYYYYSSTKGTPSTPNHSSPRTTTYPYSPAATSHYWTGGTSSNPNQASSRSTTYPYSPGAASYSTTKGTYSNGSATFSSSAFNGEKDAWIHEEFGSNYRGRGRDTRSTSRQPYYSYTAPPPPPRQESPKRETYRDVSTFHYGKIPSMCKQKLENDGVQSANISWIVRMRDDKTEDTLSLAEKDILKAATWVFKFSYGQRAHFIASRMLDDHLQYPARDKSSPPVPNLQNPAEAIALKLVEFAPFSERKQTISPRTKKQQTDEQSKTFLNNTPLDKSVYKKKQGSKGPLASDFTQTVSTRTAEQQMDEEKKPVIEYEKAEASFLQKQHSELDQVWMEKLAGCTDAEENPGSLHVFHEKTQKEEGGQVRSAKRGAKMAQALNRKKRVVLAGCTDAEENPGSLHLFHEKTKKEEGGQARSAKRGAKMAQALNRKKGVATIQRKTFKTKKRVVWLTRHIRVLEAHKTKVPTGYFKAENCKGIVLGSLCSVFSIPFKKKDGTTIKAGDRRLAIYEALGEENPRRVFDDALEDLKQQLISEMIRDYGCAQ